MDPISRELAMKRWRQIILEANNSGRPKIEYMREHNISENQFYYWQKLVRREAIATGAAIPSSANPCVPAVNGEASSFIEVSAPDASSGSVHSSPAVADDPVRPGASWTILLRRGDYDMYLNNQVSEDCLKTVLRVISNA